jgi:glycerophosphoryl diester phosphodiesterase
MNSCPPRSPIAPFTMRIRAFPENSRAAVQRAVRAGYGIEIDVHLSADGRAMVFHDDTLDR